MIRDPLEPRDIARRVAGINRTAERLDAIVANAEKTRRMRRWSWRRRWHSGPFMHPDDKRLRRIALRLGAPLPLVEAFVERLDDFASQATPRGSLEGFSIEDLAAHWNMPSDDELARIYALLESPEVGWIDRDFIVDFYARNPDHEDLTTADRTARSTAFKKAMKEIARQKRVGLITDAERDAKETALCALRDQGSRRLLTWAEQKPKLAAIVQLSTDDGTHTVSDREHRDAHGQSTANQIKKSRSVDNVADGASGESRGLSDGQAGPATEQVSTENALTIVSGQQTPADAKAWLEADGLRLLVERMGWHPGLAATRLQRWLDQDLGGDHEALAGIIGSADQRAKDNAARFHLLIADGVQRHQLGITGPQLPLVFKGGRASEPAPDRSLADAVEKLGEAIRADAAAPERKRAVGGD